MHNKLYFNPSPISKEKKDRLFTAIQKESEEVGYYSLPDQDISEISEYVNAFDECIEHIVVLGIGGSSLGAKAIDEFLKPMKTPKRELHFFESTDPINIASGLSKIDMDKAHFLVISKSGGTVETISIFKYVYAPRPQKENFTFITDKGSNLDKFAQDLGSKVFYLPENVGGRFSVLSVVGLLPLALAGVNITSLLAGAREVKESFFGNGHLSTALIEKAFFYAKNHTTYNINCLFAYSDTLKYFTEWYVQLWGESLGKEQRNSTFNVGLTPIGLIGPKDQHSFLQLIVEGTRDKSVTFIQIRDFEHEMYIPPVTLKHLEALDNVNGVAFHELINMQCNSVMECLEKKGDIPLDEIIIDQVNEESIGGLMYYYEVLTSLVGELIDVDTYNQPGVEEGKIILKQKLMS